MDKLSLDEALMLLLKKYYRLYDGMPVLPVNIVFTSCLSKAHFNIRPDLKNRLVEQGILEENDYNGRMVLPKNTDDVINILLNTDKIKEYTDDGSYTWIGTFAHEITHAIDFHTLALKEGLDNYDALLEDEFFIFHMWSEYHARKYGYNFLRSYLRVDEQYLREERVAHIINAELPRKIEEHFDVYHSTDNGKLQIYETMQFLGRISVWCDIFPGEFNDSYLEYLFKNSVFMFDLLKWLRQHEEFEFAYSKLNEMRLVLKENWKGL